ncbi:enoyl-CoA hydratase-related protein [Streptomyces spongiae]|uniref:Enoyl-CoA hydratase n=1 Tax=Streptomyces spongiae TaxID=565072 RepID=A0A5N8X886_9ACTN|nr:enoyl-CoA hydratase-related protein [Streptomyces spongiae]MPY55681.1 enoyl-CoA hydratase [Streptomyces spongiae]
MSATPPAGTVHGKVEDSVGWVTISNPGRRNALSISMMGQLDEILRRLDDDPAVRVIVLRGEGRVAFAAGADISEFEAQQAGAAARSLAEKTEASLFGGLATLSTPLIAMIHGHCLGAGVAVALGADIRIAADNSRFAVPAARLGIGYPVALTQVLVHAVGPAHAAEILFAGCALAAPEALRAGLVNRVLPVEQLEETTRALAATIAANAPLTVRAAKAAIRAAADSTRWDDAEALVALCAESEDAREGRRAFMEKRPPKFLGA